MAAPAWVQHLLTAAFPAADKVVTAFPAWQQRHPAVEIKAVSRQFAGHHTAMTAAPSSRQLISGLRAGAVK